MVKNDSELANISIRAVYRLTIPAIEWVQVNLSTFQIATVELGGGCLIIAIVLSSWFFHLIVFVLTQF